ncbi:MAG: 50S ribosomal protein L1 [Candidatus Margulisiibacteriota bacterium]
MATKLQKAISEKFDLTMEYDPLEALNICKEAAAAKFDETVELHFSLGIDPRHADQLVRGTLTLPNGTGKDVRIVVITDDENTAPILDAGAIECGLDDVLKKISDGWLDFDLVIATPKVMPKLGKLGRVLGARGLMPSPKSGTVTTDVIPTVKEFKAGKVEFRNDKEGNLHLMIGKVSFETNLLLENFMEVFSQVNKLKPSKAKGVYLKSITICSTMGPGVKVKTMDSKWKGRSNV